MRCSKCQEEKEDQCFASRGDGKLHKQCKECKKAAIKDHYEKNKKKMVARSKASNQKIRQTMTEILVEAKSKPCVDCGEKHPHYCMDFDHLPGNIKLDNIACIVQRCSIRMLLEEIAKCELVCAICHRKRTWDRSH